MPTERTNNEFGRKLFWYACVDFHTAWIRYFTALILNLNECETSCEKALSKFFKLFSIIYHFKTLNTKNTEC